MKHYANPITGRHKPSPLKADANLIMGEAAMRAAGAVKPIAHSSTEQAAEPVDEPAAPGKPEGVFEEPIELEAKELATLTVPVASDKIKRTIVNPLLNN